MSLKWLKDVAHIAPLILPFIPGVPPVLVPFIVHGIQTAEQIEGASGPEKLAASLDEVNNGINALNAVKPGAVDAGLVNDAVVKGIAATVATVNVVNDIKK